MDKKPEQPARKKRSPRKISARYLENAALYYLQRYATSVDNLRRVLTRKVNRSCAFHKEPPDEFYPLIENLLARYVQSGLLNDRGYAEAKVAGLRRQGRSRQAIFSRLQTKGLSKEDIAAALENIDSDMAEDGQDAELAAAVKLAKKRKIGKFNPAPAQDALLRRKQQQREMAVMARGGFSYDVAKRALGMEADENADDVF